jgi:hypothetical protein
LDSEGKKITWNLKQGEDCLLCGQHGQVVYVLKLSPLWLQALDCQHSFLDDVSTIHFCLGQWFAAK